MPERERVALGIRRRQIEQPGEVTSGRHVARLPDQYDQERCEEDRDASQHALRPLPVSARAGILFGSSAS